MKLLEKNNFNTAQSVTSFYCPCWEGACDTVCYCDITHPSAGQSAYFASQAAENGGTVHAFG